MKLIIQIPCYNEEKDILKTLNDLPSEIQGIDKIEILIINDGSKDLKLNDYYFENKSSREFFLWNIIDYLGYKNIKEVLIIYESLINQAAVLFSYEQIGGSQASLDMAINYAKERYAFGRPIGSYQAIKHKLADMYIALTLAKSNCYYAAWALSTDAADLPSASATARVSATKAYQLCSKENIQTHGGNGFTWEYDCHMFYRRSKLLSLNIGSLSNWREKLVTSLEQSNIN